MLCSQRGVQIVHALEPAGVERCSDVHPFVMARAARAERQDQRVSLNGQPRGAVREHHRLTEKTRGVWTGQVEEEVHTHAPSEHVEQQLE